MNRPTLEVADIIRQHGKDFIERNREQLSSQQLKVLRAIEHYRTAALGGHLDRCSCCGHRAISYNSCRNRHCPKCLTRARDRWLAAREKELLDVSYFHVVFTLPHQLSTLALRNPKVVYQLLFQASAKTLLKVAADPKHLGAHIGFLSVLHTWGQNLLAHPHVHCVVPAGGLSSDGSRWVQARTTFFLPVKVLSRVFRGKFVAGLKRAFRDAKPPFGGPQHVLHYLARYTHRVAISNHRLLSLQDGQVIFRWKDYAHGSKLRNMSVQAHEFLRRFLLHVLPKGFVRIRFFGFLANRRRGALLLQCQRFLAPRPAHCPSQAAPTVSLWLCPLCGGAMVVIERFSADEVASQTVEQGYDNTS